MRETDEREEKSKAQEHHFRRQRAGIQIRHLGRTRDNTREEHELGHRGIREGWKRWGS